MGRRILHEPVLNVLLEAASTQPSTTALSGKVRIFWFAVAIVALANLVIFDVLIVAAPPTTQVAYIPDDGYYYLVLAQNFVRTHTWTFDGGVSKTSGFHPLFAYLLAGLYWLLKPGTQGFVKVSVAVSSSLTLLSAVYLLSQGAGRRRPVTLVACLAVLLNIPNVWVNSVSSVEWPLLVLVVTLFCSLLAWGHSSTVGRILILVLGAGGSLTRSDFGILPFAFFVASVAVWWKKGETPLVKATSLGLAGAIAGVIALLLHNYVLTGLATQSSALMKMQWMNGSDSLMFLGAGLGSLLLALVGLAILHVGDSRATSKPIGDVERVFLIAASIAWTGYVLFYSAMSGVQNWYSGNLLMPVFVFLYALWSSLERGIGRRAPMAPHAVFLVLIAGLFTATILSVSPFGDGSGRWPHQRAMLRAGRYLREHPPSGRVGGWNVGIVSYYANLPVINLDGVVNNDVYRYVIARSLPSYIRERRIEYLVDFGNMFEKKAAERGGYYDPPFLSSLRPLVTFDQGEYPGWKHLTLYKIEPLQ